MRAARRRFPTFTHPEPTPVALRAPHQLPSCPDPSRVLAHAEQRPLPPVPSPTPRCTKWPRAQLGAPVCAHRGAASLPDHDGLEPSLALRASPDRQCGAESSRALSTSRRRRGRYYLFYSAGSWSSDYRMAYAVARTCPLRAAALWSSAAPAPPGWTSTPGAAPPATSSTASVRCASRRCSGRRRALLLWRYTKCVRAADDSPAFQP